MPLRLHRRLADRFLAASHSASRAIAAAVVLGSLAATSGCSRTGDFGRHDPGLFEQSLLPSLRSLGRSFHGAPVSSFPLTDDEVELRARSRTIITGERRWSVERELSTAFEAAGLMNSKYQENRRTAHDSGLAAYQGRSASRRPSALADIVASERAEFRAFADVAYLVYGADAARHAVISRGDIQSLDIVGETAARVAENRRVVEQTVIAMWNRVDDYRLELRKSAVEHPDARDPRASFEVDRMADQAEEIERRLRVFTFPDRDFDRGYHRPAA